MNWALILAVLAIFYAGLMIWLHGVYIGMRDNDLEVENLRRKLVESRRMVLDLRGQVRLLEAAMVTDLDREWAAWDK